MRGDGKARFLKLLGTLSRMCRRLCNGRERVFKQLPNFFIRCFFRKNLMASENPPGVGIDHENWMVPRIEQDGVGSFRPDSVKIEQFFPKLFRWTREHSCQR